MKKITRLRFINKHKMILIDQYLFNLQLKRNSIRIRIIRSIKVLGISKIEVLLKRNHILI